MITTDDVTLDLNGFAIMRTANGGGEGISSDKGNIRIRNGTITGFGGPGIHINLGASVEGVRSIDNVIGFNLEGVGSTVRNCVAANNSSHGILIQGATATGNITVGNGGNGIVAYQTNVITENNASGNTGDGIHAYGSTVRNNTSVGNTGRGIFCSACSVIANTVKGNTGYGLSFAGNVGYGKNFINLNTAGTVESGVQLGTNACNDSTTCP